VHFYRSADDPPGEFAMFQCHGSSRTVLLVFSPFGTTRTSSYASRTDRLQIFERLTGCDRAAT
jgi:hypothetical protein